MEQVTDGMSRSDLEIRPCHLLCTVCTLGGVECPLLIKDRIDHILHRMNGNPILRIKLVSNADEIVYFRNICPENYARMDTQEVFKRKRDLDVFQKLGLMPGATMKARELFALLFERIPSTKDVCAYGDGVLTSKEWGICGGSEGNEAYRRTIENGIFREVNSE